MPRSLRLPTTAIWNTRDDTGNPFPDPRRARIDLMGALGESRRTSCRTATTGRLSARCATRLVKSLLRATITVKVESL
jgi:hypothetical protein